MTSSVAELTPTTTMWCSRHPLSQSGYGNKLGIAPTSQTGYDNKLGTARTRRANQAMTR
jgi:hypothetical protein